MQKADTTLALRIGWAVCAAALVMSGCSSSSNSGDGGTTSDAGTTMDAGSTHDAGTTMDAGMTADAGSTDAGMTTDGGSSDAGLVMFKPSNFDPTQLSMTNLADVEGNAMSVGCTVDTDLGTINCAEQPAMTTGYTATQVSQSNGQNVEVFTMKSFKLDQDVTMYVSGSKPAIFYVLGDADLEGVINLAASGSTDGPGAFHDMGPGQGKPGEADMSGNELDGAGGASFCGTGGQGAPTSGTPMGGAAGATYGTADLSPLLGGSAGGSQASSGYGGGAFQLTATGTITIGAMGGINVNGDGGDSHGGIGGGGGSGGAILLEAQKVTVKGTLTANGGGGGSTDTVGSDGNFSATPAPGGGMTGSMTGGAGSGGDMQNGQNGSALTMNFGGGGGGAGRIRINTVDGTATITGTLSPSTHTPCATVGMVKM